MQIRRSLVTLLALFVSLALVASGCGDDSGDEAVDDESGESTEEGSDGEATNDDSEGEAPDEGEADPPDEEPLSGGVEAYCALSAEQDAADDDFDITTSTPEQSEDYFTEGLARLDQAIEVAPSEIRADLELIRDQIDAAREVLAANEWDVFAALDELEPLLASETAEAADSRLEEFDEDVCGIAPDSDDEATSDPVDELPPDELFSSPETFEAILATEFGRQAFAEGMAASGEVDMDQALCLVDNLDFEALFALGTGQGDPTPDQLSGLFEAFGTCGITPDQLLG